MKLLVIFGSLSDAPVYEPLREALNQYHETQFFALSAHRNASQLRECLQREHYDAVVAGAGLAAHLPGVVASLTQRPVIGIPVPAHLGGMDALLSILQMPPGVPVQTFASTEFSVLSEFLKTVSKKHDEEAFHFVGEEESFFWVRAKWKKVKNYCTTLGIKFIQTLKSQEHPVREATLFHLEKDSPPGKLCIPVLPPWQAQDIETTMMLAKLFKTPSLFVGLNNLVNGFIATLQWMDIPRKESVLDQLKQGKLK